MTAGNNGSFTIHSAQSFGFRLSAAPVVHYITAGSPPPADCPGTVTNPQANPGHLCAFEVHAQNVTSFRGICNPEASGCPGASASREGFAVYAQIQTAGSSLYVFGSWAVTAAAGPASDAAPAAGGPTTTGQ
jgi:hypothetical protein